MKILKYSRKYSTVVAKNLEGSAELAEEANKEAVSDLFHLGLASTVVLLILESVTRPAHTCVSNVLLSISEYANDSFKENSRKEREAFVETGELKNHECIKSGHVVMEKIAKLFPTYLMSPANRETFHPRNFCRLR